MIIRKEYKKALAYYNKYKNYLESDKCPPEMIKKLKECQKIMDDYCDNKFKITTNPPILQEFFL